MLGQDTAATTVGPRNVRITAAAAGLAWAYFVALHRGEWVRASGCLIAFQRFWNNYRNTIIANAAPAAQAQLQILPIDGQFSGPVGAAFQWVLYTNGVASADVLRTMVSVGSAAQLGQWFAFNLLPGHPESSGLWLAYRNLSRLPEQDAAVAGLQWAAALVDAIPFAPPQSTQEVIEATLSDQGFEDVINDLAPQTVTTIQPSGPEVFLIPGQTLRQRQQPVWPWVIGAGAVVLAGVGLAYHIKRRRGRR